ncbi:chitinase [Kitasatospora sp. NPDC047058]|uniref:chitinase n=1 Tax=Kitasatospora sp. NPDC047058 TaxID=3155620 RepID=UPI0033D6AD50
MSLRRSALRIAAAAVAASAIALPASASAATSAPASASASAESTTGPADATAADQAGFVVSKAQFGRMFPNKNQFYTYEALVGAMSAYPGFAHTGNDALKRREAAAFLANVSHETGGLRYTVEQNTANYPTYCDTSRPYGCPAGRAAYYGRGPLQLSWNFNYKAAGDALHIDLLHHPSLVQTDPQVSWKTALWYWNTQNGPGSMTAHQAIVTGAGFGQTIRSINGAVECNGRNTAEMQDRVNLYQRFAQILGTSPGTNLTC